jgi:retron-type reverse transcriptase
MVNKNYSEVWKSIPWRKLRRKLFRLQVRVGKAMRIGDRRTVKKLQNLILKSQSARLLAIRQVTQLNAGKKTAGVDGKKSLSFKERLELNQLLKKNVLCWQHQGLRDIPIPKNSWKKL